MNAAPDQSCTIAPPGAGNVPRGAASDARASGGGATRGRRAAPLLAFALLLLPLLGAPGPTPDRGQALAAPVIAANGGQPVSTSHFTLNDRYRAFALKFATGPNAGGYDVHAVAVRLQNASSGIMMEGRIHRLRAYVIREWLVWLPGHPAGSVLTRRTRVDRHRWNRWSADPPVHLEPNRTYAFVLDCMGACEGGRHADIGRTDSDAEDASSLPGWSIGDAMMVRDRQSMGMAHSPWSGDFVLGVDGTWRLSPREPTPLIRIEGVPVSADRQAPRAVSETFLTVSDARAHEEPGAALDFEVRLAAPRAEALNVRYATADGTATAGQDYVRTAGQLAFAPGETRRTIAVPVLDDSLDEGEETLSLHLYDAEGAPLTGAVATGTIFNSDPLPRVWLAQFGRIVGAQLVDAVQDRLLGNPSAHLRIAGTPVWQPEEAIAPDASAGPVPPPTSSFHLSAPAPDGPALSAWGRVATGGFGLSASDLRTDGTVTTALVGMDVAWDRWLVGVAASRSSAEGAYGAPGAHGESRTVRATLSGLSPYLRFAPNERTSLWALAGAGTGEQTVETAGGPAAGGIAMRLGALGAAATLLPAATTGWPTVTIRSDLLWTEMTSEAIAPPGHLAAGRSGSLRLRLAAEASGDIALGTHGTLTPAVQLGLRHERGEALDGNGIEAGAALRYAGGGVALEASVHALLAHEQRGYEEWGAAGALRIEPEGPDRGLSLTVAPRIGAAPGGWDRLWRLEGLAELAGGDGSGSGGALETRLAYGLRTGSSRGLLTPFASLSLSGAGERVWCAGASWILSPGIASRFEAERREAPGQDPVFTVTERLTLRW